MNTPLPQSITRKLLALKHPDISSQTLNDFQKLTLWLEEEKIRLLTLDKREWMRRFDGQWFVKFEDYCEELNVNCEGVNSKNKGVVCESRLRVLDRLL